MDLIKTLLASNRVKAVILAFAMAYIKKNYPEYAPDEAALEWMYGIIVTFILGDTIRPVDANKTGVSLIVRNS